MANPEGQTVEPKPDAEATPPLGLPGGYGIEALVEAALMTIDKPLPAARLTDALNESGLGFETDPAGVEAAIAALNESYAEDGRAIRIESTAGGYRVMTLPAAAGVVAAVAGARPSPRLSKAALETLAIIAYRQPITRAELEAIRGVGCGEVLRSLIERKLVTITGRAEELGRPMLYGTTRAFLETFGLSSLKDLPPMQDGATPVPLAAAASDAEAPASEEPPSEGNRTEALAGDSEGVTEPPAQDHGESTDPTRPASDAPSGDGGDSDPSADSSSN
ncbi:MAG: SMC-Scp complex subunit ScpB [Planctomycetota bacterium]